VAKKKDGGGASGNTIPDFGVMTMLELRMFARRLRKANLVYAAALVGNRRKGFSQIAKKLGKYAEYLYLSLAFEAIGRHGKAVSYQNKCNAIYNKLPEDLQW
jgi:hypothetical protein